MTGWRLGRRPGLDGLRGVAIGLVLTNHVVKHAGVFNQMGVAGVTLFFALSGFLITSLLVEEGAAVGRISLRKFYERRARRLLPALFVMLAVLTTYLSIAGLSTPAWTLVPLLYASNWFVAFGHPPPYMGHTWSLSLEEQFYFVWPLLVIAARRRTRLLVGVCVVGIVWANIARLVLWNGGTGEARVYYSSDGRADALLIGCLVALLVHRYGMPRVPSRVTAVAVGAVVLFGAMPPRGDIPLIVLALTPWAAVLAIVGCCDMRVNLGAILNWVGRRSYAIYLWLPVVSLATYYHPGVRAALAAAAVTLGVAELSWRLVERRFLQRRVVGGDPRIGQRGAEDGRVIEGARPERVTVTLRDMQPDGPAD